MKKQKIAIFLIFLIITIPFYTSFVFGQTDEKNDNKITGLAVSDDVGQQCIEKHQKTAGIADSLDNGVIGTLESVASIMFMICTVASAIDIILSAIANVIGLITNKDACCLVGAATYGSTCKAIGAVYEAWQSVYKYIEPLCCFVNCGWCTGQGCGGILGNVPLIGTSSGGYGNYGAGYFHISPYENIYTATFCMCPVAILFNLRKLKTIYQVYNCCIEQACKNGISTESCEQQLDEATCMYWQGSLMKTVVKILISVLIKYLLGQVLKIQIERLIPKCILKLMELANIPGTITSVTTAWDWMSTTFSEPKCEDLGFDKVKKQMQQSPSLYTVTLIDKNHDGIYDTTVQNGKVMESELKIKDVYPGMVLEGKQGAIIVTKEYTKTYGPGDVETLFDYLYISNGNQIPRTQQDIMDLRGEVGIIGNSIMQKNLQSYGLTFDPKGDGGKGVWYDEYGKYVIPSTGMSIEAAKLTNNPGLIATVMVEKGYRYREPDSICPQGCWVLKDQGEQSISPPLTTESGYPPPPQGTSSVVTAQEGAVIKVLNVDTGSFEQIIATGGEKVTQGIDGDYYKDKGSAQYAGAYNDPESQRLTEQAQQDAQNTKNMAEDAAWKLLDMTLGSFAYNKIDDMCKKDWQASEPQK